MTKKYHIPEIKRPKIPYTQNPWPGLQLGMMAKQLLMVVKATIRNHEAMELETL